MAFLLVFLCNRDFTENCQKDAAFFCRFLERVGRSQKMGKLQVLAASAMPRIWHNTFIVLRENSRAYALLINFGRPSLQYDTFDLDKLPSVSLLDTSVSCGEAAPQKSSIDCEV